VTERSRFRNPLAPPGVSLGVNTGEVVQSALEQKQLTGRDIRDYLAKSLPLARYADVASGVML
jgi:hypothetical protein